MRMITGKWRAGVFILLLTTFSFLLYCKQREERVSAAEGVIAATQKPAVLLLFNSKDRYAARVIENARQALHYARIVYKECDLAASALPDLHPYAAMAMMTEMIYKLPANECRRIEEYVATGGGLAVLYRGWNRHLLSIFGIEPDTRETFYEEEQTLQFVSDFIPGIKGSTIRDQDFSCYDVRILPGAKILAQTDRVPIAWYRTFGKGRVVYWNTSLMAEKVNRGFILRSLSLVLPITIIPIANLGLFYLDDYPNSSSNKKVEPIKSECDQSMTEFYYLRWYPDMMRLAKKYGLKFTAAIVFNYNGLTSPPYTFREWLNGKIQFGDNSITAGRWAVQNLDRSNELGLHGYNHQSLTLTNWQSIGNMEDALAQARRRWIVDNLGTFPFTYVPPHNIYDSTGVQALHHVFPEIKVIAGQYLGDFALGGDREYAPEPWNEEIYDMPRITSGFILTEFDKRAMLSLLQMIGLWSHFVHPDDVYPFGERYDEEMLAEAHLHTVRWYGKPKKNGLYYQLDRWLQFVQKHYPWLRFMTTKAALPELKRYLNSRVSYAVENNGLHVATDAVPIYFYLYVPRRQKIASVKGAKIVYQYPDALDRCYVLKAKKNNVLIRFSPEKTAGKR